MAPKSQLRCTPERLRTSDPGYFSLKCGTRPPITLQPASCLSNEISNAVTHPIVHGEHRLWFQENSFAKHLQDDLYFPLVQRDVLLRERERVRVINIQDTLPTNLRSRLSPTQETHRGE